MTNKNSSPKRSGFFLHPLDIYLFIVTLAYLAWRGRVFWERLAG